MPASQAGRHGFESRRPLSYPTMPSRCAVLVLAALGGAIRLAAQQTWTPPQTPCDLKAGHFRVNSAIVDLRSAAQQPITRDRMLQQTLDVLTRTITGDGQDKNPAAWYYLGRYYVEVGDAGGADSAFDRAEALAPQCRQDIDGYRQRLWTDVVNAGLRNWQENRPDSAVRLLRQAVALRPTHPRAFLALGQLYASQDQLDSAAAYLTKGAELAGNDPAFAENKKDALGNVARLALRRVQSDPAAQRWQHTRYSRDSIQRLVAVDSSVLARIDASAASRRARGARLAPADQQAFARDSGARAQGVTEHRTALAARATPAAADSSAAQPVFQAGIQAFRTYLAAYPDAADAVTGLASLYYQSGRASEAEAAFDAIYPSGGPAAADVLIEARRGRSPEPHHAAHACGGLGPPRPTGLGPEIQGPGRRGTPGRNRRHDLPPRLEWLHLDWCGRQRGRRHLRSPAPQLRILGRPGSRPSHSNRRNRAHSATGDPSPRSARARQRPRRLALPALLSDISR